MYTAPSVTPPLSASANPGDTAASTTDKRLISFLDMPASTLSDRSSWMVSHATAPAAASTNSAQAPPLHASLLHESAISGNWSPEFLNTPCCTPETDASPQPPSTTGADSTNALSLLSRRAQRRVEQQLESERNRERQADEAARRGLRNLFIAWLPPTFTDQDLNNMASVVGSISSCRVIHEERRSYGFVMFDDSAAAAEAVKHLGRQVVNGRRLQVHLSKKGSASASSASPRSLQDNAPQQVATNSMSWSTSPQPFSVAPPLLPPPAQAPYYSTSATPTYSTSSHPVSTAQHVLHQHHQAPPQQEWGYFITPPPHSSAHANPTMMLPPPAQLTLATAAPPTTTSHHQHHTSAYHHHHHQMPTHTTMHPQAALHPYSQAQLPPPPPPSAAFWSPVGPPMPQSLPEASLLQRSSHFSTTTLLPSSAHAPPPPAADSLNWSLNMPSSASTTWSHHPVTSPSGAAPPPQQQQQQHALLNAHHYPMHHQPVPSHVASSAYNYAPSSSPLPAHRLHIPPPPPHFP